MSKQIVCDFCGHVVTDSKGNFNLERAMRYAVEIPEVILNPFDENNNRPSPNEESKLHICNWCMGKLRQMRRSDSND